MASRSSSGNSKFAFNPWYHGYIKEPVTNECARPSEWPNSWAATANKFVLPAKTKKDSANSTRLEMIILMKFVEYNYRRSLSACRDSIFRLRRSAHLHRGPNLGRMRAPEPDLGHRTDIHRCGILCGDKDEWKLWRKLKKKPEAVATTRRNSEAEIETMHSREWRNQITIYKMN